MIEVENSSSALATHDHDSILFVLEAQATVLDSLGLDEVRPVGGNDADLLVAGHRMHHHRQHHQTGGEEGHVDAGLHLVLVAAEEAAVPHDRPYALQFEPLRSFDDGVCEVLGGHFRHDVGDVFCVHPAIEDWEVKGCRIAHVARDHRQVHVHLNEADCHAEDVAPVPPGHIEHRCSRLAP